jgi:hypothetical protein
MPLTTPPVEILPIDGALLVHVPPGVASLRLMVLFTHTCVGPLMADGPGLTVTGLVTVQLVPPNV